jgi:hypothetical protein
MFFFQTMFQQVYNGITGSSTLSTVQTIAEGILLLSALFGMYEAWARGGDVRAIALTGVRYLVMGLVLSQYATVFLSVNNAFNGVAQTISPNDVATNWRTQFGAYLSSMTGGGWSAWYNLIPGGVAGVFSLLFQAIAVIIFPITYVLFSFFYSMYGAVIYVFGPLVLALFPALGVGQMARTYMVNLLVWNAWGIIYAVMSQLLTIMSAGSLTSVLASQGFGGAWVGASQMMLISLSSILLSLMIALIPFIARRVVSGDLGSTMFAALSLAGTAMQTAAVAIAVFASGLKGGGGDDGPGGGGGGDGNPAAKDSNKAPKPPDPPGDKGSDGNVGGSSGDEASGKAPKGPDAGGRTQKSETSASGANESPGIPEDHSGHQSDQASSGNAPNGGASQPDNDYPRPTSGSNSAPRGHRPHVSGLYYIPSVLSEALGTATGHAYRKVRGPRNSGKE